MPGPQHALANLPRLQNIRRTTVTDCLHSGRPIAVHFLTLPDRVSPPDTLPAATPLTTRAQSEFSNYYEAIKLPIAIDTIEVCTHRLPYLRQSRLVPMEKAHPVYIHTEEHAWGIPRASHKS